MLQSQPVAVYHIDNFEAKSRGREISWKILTVAKVRDDVGSGSGRKGRKRVNGSKNTNGEHFGGKEFCDYKQPSPIRVLVFVFVLLGGGVMYTEQEIHSLPFSLISPESTYSSTAAFAQMSSLPHTQLQPQH